MNNHKIFYYPKSVKEILKDKIQQNKFFTQRNRLDKLLYILHHLYRSKEEYSTEYYNKNGVLVHSEILREIIGEPNHKPFIDSLVAWQLITLFSDSYQVDMYSKAYKLHPSIAGLNINRNKHYMARKNSWMNKFFIKKHMQV